MTGRAAVVGSPVAHSLSPVLHRAGYAALGLDGWRYDAIECDDVALPGFVAGLDESWAGLSVTMPGKHAAIALAASATPTALAVGAANTLVQLTPGRWLADCTDVDGVAGALRAAGFSTGTRGVVVGAGGTACAALTGLARLGVTDIALAVRSPARAAEARACAARLGVSAPIVELADLAAACATADVVVSTVPAGAADAYAADLARCPYILDVVYHPWPTPLARTVSAQGGRLASGLDMLLHQSFGQFRHFTGH
ncbi:MAG TPA: shikimate dehydrogenase, partial [Pseudonocardiaceae bacterium]|nr:shikimate dehydrogenase [Pseudonocardiaceae bacterium]